MFLALPFYIAVLFYSRRKSERNNSTIARVERNIACDAAWFSGVLSRLVLDLKGLEYISAQLERLTLFTYPTMIAVLAAVFLRKRSLGESCCRLL